MSQCEHKNIATLSDKKCFINDVGRYDSTPFANNICLGCYCHWYGDKFYTKQEWDAWINTAFDEVKL